MKILAISPAPDDGTSFYRFFGPLNRLERDNEDIRVTDASSMNITWQILGQHDIVLMQRPFLNEMARVAEMCEIHRIPLIVDYDDDLFSVEEHNRSHDLYQNPHWRENIRYICSKAQQVWVSTHHLAEAFRQEGIDGTFRIIPNAIDLEHFPMSNLPRTKIIAYRGGDSHKEDWAEYYDEFMELVDELPEYKFAFFGYCPQNIIDNMPSDRFIHFRFSDPWVFMRNLHELRPEMLIVPLKSSYFNQSKSDVAFLEATSAGALTIAPEFIEAFGLHHKLLWQYTNDEHMPGSHFKQTIKKAINAADSVVPNAQKHIVENRSLTQINAKRVTCMTNVLYNYDTSVQVKKVEDAVPATEQEFCDFEYHMGVNLDNDEYLTNVKKIVDDILKESNPKTVLDVGCGCGAYVSEFLNRGITAHGVEPRGIHKDDWDIRFPNWSEFFIQSGFLETRFEDTVDLAMCIEVLEHIPHDEAEKWVEKMGKMCKYLLFTSTPWADAPAFDIHWGHINVKPESHWEALFKQKGFILVKKHQSPADWGMLFINANL